MEKQRESQAQKKSVGTNALIIVLILIMLATSAFGIFAWARYQTSIEGESTAQVAKWSFKVNGNGTQTEQVSFLMTRTDSNNTVVSGTIAPGTYGEIPIEIDVTGTQTDLIYTILGSTVNMPRNIKLYFDENRTQELAVVGQQFSKGKYLKLADIGTGEKVITETIYWEWPFETGEIATDIERNNIIDTEDMGKTMTMALTIEGKQLNGAPVLADLVQVGDYVNYDASSNGPKTFTSNDCLTGTSLSATISTDQAFNSGAKSQWRVLSVDKKQGTVELMAADPTAQAITLSAGDGFINAEDVLNSVGAIYGQGKGATGGRSITIEDVEQYSSYDKTTYKNWNNIYYGESINYISGNFYKEIKDGQGNVTGYEDIITAASSSSLVTMTQTYYGYSAQSYYSNSTIYNMIFKNSTSTSSNKTIYWLASPSVDLGSNSCGFIMSVVYSGRMSNNQLYNSNGNVFSPASRVVPVVSLESNIQTTGQDANGVWQLKVD